MSRTKAMTFGVLGFFGAGVVALFVYAVISETYRKGYNDGFQCARYEICR